MDDRFRFGIEEELFLADAVTRGTPGRSLKAFHKAVREQVPKTERELLESQVEIASPPTTSFDEARAYLSDQRNRLAEVGRQNGILLLASGTHPRALWSRQKRTIKTRYNALSDEMRIIAQRDFVCGMHVHVEVPEPDRRVDLMNRLLPYTPVLLALSTSSPLWQGRNTGLAAYRMSVWGEMPRTGLPELFESGEEYEGYVATMVKAGVMKDASFLWWTLRPSVRYPTLELRVADSCTNLEDSLSIAALYRCLVRRVVREPMLNGNLTGASRAIVSENLWRAQRDGVKASFIDEATGEVVQCRDYIAALIDAVAIDALNLGCLPELKRTQQIIADGSSSDHQLRVLNRFLNSGSSTREAIIPVVDWIAQVTAGLPT
jgi:glutamate---cysteine ligase / carboxylate-amine ligase